MNFKKSLKIENVKAVSNKKCTGEVKKIIFGNIGTYVFNVLL